MVLCGSMTEALPYIVSLVQWPCWPERWDGTRLRIYRRLLKRGTKLPALARESSPSSSRKRYQAHDLNKCRSLIQQLFATTTPSARAVHTVHVSCHVDPTRLSALICFLFKHGVQPPSLHSLPQGRTCRERGGLESNDPKRRPCQGTTEIPYVRFWNCYEICRQIVLHLGLFDTSTGRQIRKQTLALGRWLQSFSSIHRGGHS